MPFELSTGAEARWTGAPGRRVVVCVNGGTAAEVPGTWSASVEWLVRELSRRFPELGFLEVRYRIKSWRRLELCVEDAAAANRAAREGGAEELALLGFSMGGAVAVRNAAAAGVELVAGVNPWLPPQLELGTLRGRRLAIAHGALDAPLPLIPGVKPSMSQAAAERARALGIEVERDDRPTRLPRGCAAPPRRRHARAAGRRAVCRLRRRSAGAVLRVGLYLALRSAAHIVARAALPHRDRRLPSGWAGDRGREPRVAARPAAARPRLAATAALPREGRALALPAGRLADGRARWDPDPPRPPRPALGRPGGGAAPRRRERRDLPAGNRSGRPLDAGRGQARPRHRHSARARSDHRHEAGAVEGADPLPEDPARDRASRSRSTARSPRSRPPRR